MVGVQATPLAPSSRLNSHACHVLQEPTHGSQNTVLSIINESWYTGTHDLPDSSHSTTDACSASESSDVIRVALREFHIGRGRCLSVGNRAQLTDLFATLEYRSIRGGRRNGHTTFPTNTCQDTLEGRAAGGRLRRLPLHKLSAETGSKENRCTQRQRELTNDVTLRSTSARARLLRCRPDVSRERRLSFLESNTRAPDLHVHRTVTDSRVRTTHCSGSFTRGKVNAQRRYVDVEPGAHGARVSRGGTRNREARCISLSGAHACLCVCTLARSRTYSRPE